MPVRRSLASLAAAVLVAVGFWYVGDRVDANTRAVQDVETAVRDATPPDEPELPVTAGG